MQPCGVCGSTAINEAGYCAACGAFRGVAQQAAPPPPGYPAAPTGYPQVSGAGGGYPGAGGYPAGGAGGYPVSGPGGGYPTSGGPGGYPAQPTSGYPAQAAPGYPQYAPPQAAPGRGRMFVAPLIALSATLVVLVVAIVIVVVVRNNGDDGKQATGGDPTAPGTTAPATPAENPDVDSCVVGTWKITSHREKVSLDSFGTVLFVNKGSGATVELNADGTGVTDFGDSSAYEGTASDQTIRLEVSGVLKYDFTARGGTISFSNLNSDATAEVFLNGESYGENPFEGSIDPSRYTCSGDSLVEQTDLYTTKLTRTS